MPKVKTKKIITKRIKVTKTGKIFRGRSFTSHLKVKKSQKKKRELKRQVELKGFYAKKIRKALGQRNG
jgi:large subunit ribosomal protein L35